MKRKNKGKGVLTLLWRTHGLREEKASSLPGDGALAPPPGQTGGGGVTVSECHRFCQGTHEILIIFNINLFCAF